MPECKFSLVSSDFFNIDKYFVACSLHSGHINLTILVKFSITSASAIENADAHSILTTLFSLYCSRVMFSRCQNAMEEPQWETPLWCSVLGQDDQLRRWQYSEPLLQTRTNLGQCVGLI